MVFLCIQEAAAGVPGLVQPARQRLQGAAGHIWGIQGLTAARTTGYNVGMAGQEHRVCNELLKYLSNNNLKTKSKRMYK